MRAAPNVAATRQRLESAVERAIELLNQIDGDPDEEESCEGACQAEDMPPGGPTAYAPGDGDDAELNGDEFEPSAPGAEH